MADEVKTTWNLFEWLKPYIDPVMWWRRLNKTAQYAIIIFLVFKLIGWFSPKPMQNISKPSVWVLPGGHFTGDVTSSPDQKIGQKKAWWIPTLFGEAYGFAERATDSSSRAGIGGKGGLRWEF